MELSPHSEGTGLDWSFEAWGETWVSKCGGHYLACTMGGSSLFPDLLRILTSGIITSRSVGYLPFKYSSLGESLHCWKIHLWINRNMYWGWLMIMYLYCEQCVTLNIWQICLAQEMSCSSPSCTKVGVVDIMWYSMILQPPIGLVPQQRITKVCKK